MVHKLSIYPNSFLLKRIKRYSKKSSHSMNRFILLLLENGINDIEKDGINSLYDNGAKNNDKRED